MKKKFVKIIAFFALIGSAFSAENMTKEVVIREQTYTISVDQKPTRRDCGIIGDGYDAFNEEKLYKNTKALEETKGDIDGKLLFTIYGDNIFFKVEDDSDLNLIEREKITLEKQGITRIFVLQTDRVSIEALDNSGYTDVLKQRSNELRNGSLEDENRISVIASKTLSNPKISFAGEEISYTQSFEEGYSQVYNFAIFLRNKATREVFGGVLCEELSNTDLLIDTLFINEKLRGNGLTGELLQVVEQYVKSLKLKKLLIDTQNPIAYNAYKKYGFQTTHVRPNGAEGLTEFSLTKCIPYDEESSSNDVE